MDKSMVERADPEVLEVVGRRLRALRKARGLTLEETARATGLHPTTVSRAEHGDNPTLLTVVRLLRAYGRLAAIDGFIPEAGVSPMALVRERGRSDSDSEGEAGG
ncbi:MAG: helix-turn-helix transcriptional regulator [Gemmatimonadota bacterium]